MNTTTFCTDSPVKVIIDQDGGCDDFVALMYAFMSKRFDVRGITIVAGNTSVSNVFRNTCKALDMAGIGPDKAKEIGIYLPEKVNKDIISDGAHGDNGLGGVHYELPEGYEPNNETAEDFMIRTVSEEPGEIYIVAIGPLTNIANVMDKDPTFVKKVKGIVVMGGDVGGGNITPYAEFNVYSDPEAAKKVFKSGFESNITMIGFDQSKFVTLCPEVESFLKTSGEMGKFIYDITRVTADLDRSKNKVDGASMNDVLTLLYLLYGEKIFSTMKALVEVDVSDAETRGETIVMPFDGNVQLITGINIEMALQKVLNVLFPGNSKEVSARLFVRMVRLAMLKSAEGSFSEEQLHSWFKDEGADKRTVSYMETALWDLVIS